MVRYACHHGVTTAAHYYSRKLKRQIQSSTIHSIKIYYLDEIKKLRATGKVTGLDKLPLKKQGRPVLLGEKIDTIVQEYLKKVCEAGGGVSSCIVIAAAREILKTLDKTRLKEFGGYIDLNRHWAQSLLKRMHFVQRRATTS